MPAHTRVLVVDAETPDALALRHLLAAAGYETSQASTTDDALDTLERLGADVVLLAFETVGLHGVTLLGGATGASAGLQIVLLAQPQDAEAARDGLRLGAYDVVTRGGDTDTLLFAIERAARAGAMLNELAHLRSRVGEAAQHALIGRSAAMARVRELIGRAAASRMTVLVTGEAGSGKDVVARLVHDLSDRAARPFVTVRCAGVDGRVLEEELFGVVGPGGTLVRCGLFEQARGGTLVLDEVTGLPYVLRERLARVLAERAVRRVAIGDPVPVDVRLILTAREHLEHAPLFTSGDELIGRLNVLPIALPPLRERRSDIPLLVHHFRGRLARELGVELAPIGTDGMMPLLGHQWPGNVRELENWAEREAYAPTTIRSSTGPSVGDAGDDFALPGAGEWTLEELERRYTLHVLEQEDGHQSKAAERLGIDRRTLYRKLKQYRDEGAEMKQAI